MCYCIVSSALKASVDIFGSSHRLGLVLEPCLVRGIPNSDSSVLRLRPHATLTLNEYEFILQNGRNISSGFLLVTLDFGGLGDKFL